MGLVLSDTEVSMFAVFTPFALRARTALPTALAALALFACDDAPAGTAPSISELSYAPDEAPVASPFQVTGQLDFTDPDGDLAAIVFQITAPDGTPSAPSRSKLSGTDGLTAASLQITFTAIDVGLNAHELLRDINQELVRVNAGVYVYRVEPVEEASPVQHLYPEGRIPALTNAHTRADVTGYAVLQDRPYQHTLVYVGIAAHKTSVESLWASLIRGKGSCSMRGTSVLADGEVKMLTQPLPEFNVLHAGIVCRKALPGKWEAKDDAAYALVFEGGDVEVQLQALTLKRLQETLAFPIPDAWAKTLWEYALDAEYIQRLVTGGDCRGGVRLDLSKPWQDLGQNLLEQEVLKI